MTAEQLAAATQAKVFLAIGSLVVDRASLQAQVEALTAAQAALIESTKMLDAQRSVLRSIPYDTSPTTAGAHESTTRTPPVDDFRHWPGRVFENKAPIINRTSNDGRGRAGGSASPVDGDER